MKTFRSGFVVVFAALCVVLCLNCFSYTDRNRFAVKPEVESAELLTDDKSIVELSFIEVYKYGSDVAIWYNGEGYECDYVCYNNEVLIPAREAFTLAGANDIEWISSTKTITANGDGISVSMTVGSPYITVNGISEYIDEPIQIISGTVYAPLFEILMAFEYECRIYSDLYEFQKGVFLTSSVNITEDEMNVNLGDEFMFQYEMVPENLPDDRLFCDIDNTSVVNIENQKLKAVGVGTTKIYVSPFRGLFLENLDADNCSSSQTELVGGGANVNVVYEPDANDDKVFEVKSTQYGGISWPYAWHKCEFYPGQKYLVQFWVKTAGDVHGNYVENATIGLNFHYNNVDHGVASWSDCSDDYWSLLTAVFTVPYDVDLNSEMKIGIFSCPTSYYGVNFYIDNVRMIPYFGSLADGTYILPFADINKPYDTCVVNVTAPKPEEYTVTFNTNGGTGWFLPITVQKNNYAYISYSIPSREGYTFDCWSTADGKLSYNPGASFLVTDDLEFYAVWKKTGTDDIVIDLNANENDKEYMFATISNFEIVDNYKGYFEADVTGFDPYISFNHLKFDAGVYKYITIDGKIISNDGNYSTIYFATQYDTALSEGKAVRLNTSYTGDFLPYTFNMSSHPSWQNTINNLRIEPILGKYGNSRDGTVIIDKITISSHLPVTGIYLDKTNVNMNIGDTLKLNAEVCPENAVYKKLVWISSNDSVATVNNGNVQAVGIGNAVITVKTEDGKNTDSCEVTVEKGNTKVILNSCSAQPKDIITIDIEFSNNSVKFNSFAIYDFCYDESVLTFVGFEENEELSGDAFIYSLDDDLKTITLGFMLPQTYNGNVAKIKFEVSENAREGDIYEISASCVIKNSSIVVEHELKKCIVEIIIQKLGDINLDGNIDIDDSILLFQNSMVPHLYPIEYSRNRDFDKNGNVDIDDSILLFQHSMIPYLYPLE